MEITTINFDWVKRILFNDNSLLCSLDGLILSVPIQEGNRHYDEIMRQVNAGTLTIQDADQGE